MTQQELQEIQPATGGLNAQFSQMLKQQGQSNSVQIEAQRVATQVLAQVLVAQNTPRDLQVIRAHMLEMAKNPAFAEQAVGCKPVGDGIEYKTVEMAKYMASVFRNFQWESIEHDPINGVSQVETQVWDVEQNSRARVVVSIEHKEKRSQQIVMLHDPKEYRQLVKARTSETVRNAILSLMPADLVKEVFETCLITLDKSQGDFEKTSKAALEHFEKEFGVNKGQIASFLHIKNDFSGFKPKHVRRLRALAKAIKDGEVNPSDIWTTAKDVPTLEQAAKASKKGKAAAGKEAPPAEAKQEEGKSTAETSQSTQESAKTSEPQAVSAQAESTAAVPSGSDTQTTQSDSSTGTTSETAPVAATPPVEPAPPPNGPIFAKPAAAGPRF